MAWYDYLLSGAGSLIGGALGVYGQNSANSANRDINRQNNDFSAKQAQMNRDFQERMSDTSWQRGVADMKAAGVNPLLAFSQGGASSPSGNSAQGIAQANQQNELSGAASSARDALQLNMQSRELASKLALNKANVDLLRENTRKTKGDANVSEAEGSLAGLGLRFLLKGLGGVSTAAGVYKTVKSVNKKPVKRISPASYSFRSISRPGSL